MAKNLPLFVDIGEGLSIRVGLPAIDSWDSAGRPQKVQKGTFGINFQTNNLEYWDGITWLAAPMSEE